MGVVVDMETAAELADLYRWRDRNAWRIRDEQHEVNDRHIERCEQCVSEETLAEARRLA